MTTDDGGVERHPTRPTRGRPPGSRKPSRDGGARSGWADAFRRMATRGDDRLIDGDWPATDFDKAEWEW